MCLSGHRLQVQNQLYISPTAVMRAGSAAAKTTSAASLNSECALRKIANSQTARQDAALNNCKS